MSNTKLKDAMFVVANEDKVTFTCVPYRECKMELIEDRWADDCACNAWECSECCYVSYISNLCPKPKYCPYCGARVVE